mgnify:CR=1 FL=1
MKIFKSILFILLFLSLSINLLKAEDKIAYINIDYILSNSLAGKSLLNKLKKNEELKINKFKSSDEKFKNKEKKILAKKNLVSEEEISQELKSLQIEFQKYRNNKIKDLDELKKKRNQNIINFLTLINPVIEKYMNDNSIYMLLDKKNVFIAKKNYDITFNIIDLIDNQIKNIEIK